ncbi:hypothetical protein R1flu_021923 [Riccia fluitans]|uniref:Protein CHROMATIN REMODELING 24 n=1 Tax=Riccia fluitans TaxID=41844 RepID=A0ABD1ZSB3_9MARC
MERQRRGARGEDPSKQERHSLLAAIAERRAQKSYLSMANRSPLPISDDSGSDSENHQSVRGNAVTTSSSGNGEKSLLDDTLNNLAGLSIQGSSSSSSSSNRKDEQTGITESTPSADKTQDVGKGIEQFRTPPEKFSKEVVSLSSDDEEDSDFQPIPRKPVFKPSTADNSTLGLYNQHRRNSSPKKSYLDLLSTRQESKKPTSGASSDDKSASSGAADFVLGDDKKRFCLTGSVAQKLYPHQVEGLKWLWSLHVKKTGGVLGDDMGLGKTRQIASFLAGLFSSRLIKRAMVVAPKTLLAHWANELAEVGLGRKTFNFAETSSRAREIALQGLLQRGGVLLTTYDTVRCNYKVLRGEFQRRDVYDDNGDEAIVWHYLILDEGHLIKNPATERSKSLREIESTHRIILSGTPIQNHLKEMWALFDFCCPSLLGDRKEFKDKYENKIMNANDKLATDRAKRVGAAAAQELRERIAPYFLRRLKSEVFPEQVSGSGPKLSRKNDLIVWLKLSKRQEKLYRAFLGSEAVGNALGGRQALTALAVMKKICDHPSLLTQRAADDIAEGMEEEDAAEAEAMTAALAGLIRSDPGFKHIEGDVSCKIAFLVLLLEKLVEEGHRTLIFSQTRKMLNIIQEEIERRRWSYRRIDGTMKSCDREQNVQDFQTNPHIPLFLLTSQVGGLGLTLTAADRVVIVDPAWNPSTDNQSVDRAYRIGQKKNVVVYRLMTCGTLEEKIYRKQVFKGGLMRTATETKNQLRYFSRQELHELFRVPETGFNVSVTQRQMAEEHAGEHRADDDLEEHIRYLEDLDVIAGVSHHDLLYSKAAPELPPAPDDEEDATAQWEQSSTVFPRRQSHKPPAESYIWEQTQNLSTSSRTGAYNLALNPAMEESKLAWLRSSFLKDKIRRMAAVLEHEEMSSKLSDGGAKVMQKIKELNAEVAKLEIAAALFKENVDNGNNSTSKENGSRSNVVEKTQASNQSPKEPAVRVRSASDNNIYTATRTPQPYPSGKVPASKPAVVDLESRLSNVKF